MEIINSSRLWNKRKKLGLSGYTVKSCCPLAPQIRALFWHTLTTRLAPQPFATPLWGMRQVWAFSFHIVWLESDEPEDECDSMYQSWHLSTVPFHSGEALLRAGCTFLLSPLPRRLAGAPQGSLVLTVPLCTGSASLVSHPLPCARGSEQYLFKGSWLCCPSSRLNSHSGNPSLFRSYIV